MRTFGRYLPLAVLVAGLTACGGHSAVSPAAGSAPATPVSILASSGASAADTGPLGVLMPPAGATPWKENTKRPLNLDAFVQQFYVEDAWTVEKGLYTARGFKSGTVQGWFTLDGSQQEIAIARFATAKGALSLLDGLNSSFRDEPKPATALTDAAVNGLGWVTQKLDSEGETKAEIAFQAGDTVIDVTDWSPVTPGVANLKALVLKQYQNIKSGT